RFLVDAVHGAHGEGQVRAFVVSPHRELLGLLVDVRGPSDLTGLTGPVLEHARHIVEVGRALEPNGRAVDTGPSLTGKESQVLAGLAEGRSNAQIAADLGIAVSTVKTHLKHLFHKLDAKRRTQAVARARELGCLP
ncbi:MAG: helix-turn-helix transcriptional regulator, partial [Acidobacteriota bacterium]